MIAIKALLAASQIVLASPDNRVQIAVAHDGASFTVRRDGDEIVSRSPLGLEFTEASELAGLKVLIVKKTTQRHLIPLIATKSRQA